MERVTVDVEGLHLGIADLDALLVGPGEPPGSLTALSRRITKLLGQAVGFGLEADIRDAYAFLINHFEPGDRVYFFGFSRGAYTIRAVTALLHMYGLIRPGNEPLIPYVAINNMRASEKQDYSGLLDFPSTGRQKDFQLQFSEILKIAS
jgi:hypothetical protein